MIIKSIGVLLYWWCTILLVEVERWSRVVVVVVASSLSSGFERRKTRNREFSCFNWQQRQQRELILEL